MSFNPNATQTLGLEWPVTGSALNFLDATSKGQVERFTSSTTETIDQIDAYLNNIGESGRWAAEIYESGEAIANNIQTVVIAPRTNVGSNVERDAGGGGGSPWQNSDGGNSFQFNDFTVVATEEAESNWDDSFYGQNAENVEPKAHIAFRGGGLSTFTGKRILRVDLWIRWKSAGGAANGFPVFEAASGNDLIVGPQRAVPIGPGFTTSSLGRFDLSPITSRPWTAEEGNLYFSNSSTRRFGVRMSWNTLPTAIQVSAIWAQVVVADENRVAFGYASIAENDGWKVFNLSRPDGTDNWAKVSGTEYDVLLRRISATGSIAWPVLISESQFCPHVGHRAITINLDGSYGTGLGYGNELLRAHPVRFITTGAADSLDGQPYAVIAPSDIYSGTVVRSQFNGAANADYGFIKFVVRPAIGAPSDLLPLTVKVKKQSDNTQVGGTVTLTKAQVDNFPDISGSDGWKLASAQIATATLATGTGYYMEFSSTAGGVAPTRRWQVSLLSAVGAGAVTYGGTGQSVEVVGFGEFTDVDMAATISVPPATPSGWATVVVTP